MQGNVAEAQPARGNPLLLRMGLVIISSSIQHQRARQHFIPFSYRDVSVAGGCRDRQLNITFP